MVSVDRQCLFFYGRVCLLTEGVFLLTDCVCLLTDGVCLLTGRGCRHGGALQTPRLNSDDVRSIRGQQAIRMYIARLQGGG